MKYPDCHPGDIYGRWTLLHRKLVPHVAYKVASWECRCECGIVKTVTEVTLKRGTSKSCGCLQQEIAANLAETSCLTHGHARADGPSPTYRTWKAMHTRCNNPNDRAFHRYGGRGITIDPRWSDFPLFLLDMGEKPTGLSLGRKDTDLGYSKDNCRWETDHEQQNNRSTNVLLTHEGITRTMAEWAKVSGLKLQTLHARLTRHKWPLVKALTTGVSK